MKTNLLIFGTKNFNNSLDEIKEDLDFSFIYFEPDIITDSLVSTVAAIIVENDICQNKTILSFINKISSKPILLTLPLPYANRIVFALISFNNSGSRYNWFLPKIILVGLTTSKFSIFFKIKNPDS